MLLFGEISQWMKCSKYEIAFYNYPVNNSRVRNNIACKFFVKTGNGQHALLYISFDTMNP
jgi:hypothetical protein